MGQSQASFETVVSTDQRQQRPLLSNNPGSLLDTPRPLEDEDLPETVTLGPPATSSTSGLDLMPKTDKPSSSYRALASTLPLKLDSMESRAEDSTERQHEDIPHLNESSVPALNHRRRLCSGCPNPGGMPGCLPHTWCEEERLPKAEEDEETVKLDYSRPLEIVMLRHVDDMLTPNGGVYTGQIGLDGRPHGDGAQTYVDGALYTGQWEEGAAHGEGRLLLKTGNQYSGSWQAGLKHGKGHETYDGDSEYRGNFERGHRHGHGNLTLGNGSKYEGDFAEGEFHGEGRLLWPDARVYAGQWQYGLMHGFGKFDWPDGKSHSGHYEEDRRHGAGVFHWPDGSLCKGRWQDGKLHGSGTYIDAEGNSRHGRWEHGERKYWT